MGEIPEVHEIVRSKFSLNASPMLVAPRRIDRYDEDVGGTNVADSPFQGGSS
jgi:hypothetical protein